MKTREARDKMVSRVNDAYAKWPKFHDLPPASGDFVHPLNEAKFAVDPNTAYVEALFSAASRGEPVGRSGMSVVANKSD